MLGRQPAKNSNFALTAKTLTMKLTILLLSVSLAILSSCTTSYKTGQTPDDVYYSPERTQDEYVRTDREEDEPRYNDDYYENRYLRMKVRNRTRWSDLDDWYYSDYRNRYNVYLGCCFCYSNQSPYSQWNNHYNPYYQNYVIIKNVKSPVYTKPRTFNLNAYNTSQQNTRNYSNPKLNSSGNTNNTNNNYSPRSNRDNNTGDRLRETYKSSNSSSSTSSPTKTSSSSSSSSSNNSSSGGTKSGSSGSSAPVRRF